MKVYEVWDDTTGAVVHVEAHSFDDAVEEHARKLIDDGWMSDSFDVVARDDAGEWVSVRVELETRVEVSLMRSRPCRDPRGEVDE